MSYSPLNIETKQKRKDCDERTNGVEVTQGLQRERNHHTISSDVEKITLPVMVLVLSYSALNTEIRLQRKDRFQCVMKNYLGWKLLKVYTERGLIIHFSTMPSKTLQLGIQNKLPMPACQINFYQLHRAHYIVIKFVLDISTYCKPI